MISYSQSRTLASIETKGPGQLNETSFRVSFGKFCQSDWLILRRQRSVGIELISKINSFLVPQGDWFTAGYVSKSILTLEPT